MNISFLWIIPGSFLAGVTVSYILSLLQRQPRVTPHG